MVERLRRELRELQAENTLLKNRRPLREGREVAMYELIHAARENIPVARACRALKVSRSGFYEWRVVGRAHAPSTTPSWQQKFRRYSTSTEGAMARRAFAARSDGRAPTGARNASPRLMRPLGLRGYTLRRFRKTTDSRHTRRIAPNLLEREFTALTPNQVIAGDMTYIPTTDGWLHLAVLLDLYSRRVVGWATSDRIDTELALTALHKAASTRELEPGWIHHTDRDCRYGSDEYLAALERLAPRPSMSRKGDCWDNAVSECFFATMEKELLAPPPLQSRAATRQQVADYIEGYYNLIRLHSHLDYVSPVEFETNAPADSSSQICPPNRGNSQALFDAIDHKLLMRAVRKHCTTSWVLAG
jgi:transposase InsO family protein